MIVVIERRTKKRNVEISKDTSLRSSVVAQFQFNCLSFGKREVLKLKLQHEKGKLVGSTVKSTINIKAEAEEEVNEEVEPSSM